MVTSVVRIGFSAWVRVAGAPAPAPSEVRRRATKNSQPQVAPREEVHRFEALENAPEIWDGHSISTKLVWMYTTDAWKWFTTHFLVPTCKYSIFETKKLKRGGSPK